MKKIMFFLILFFLMSFNSLFSAIAIVLISPEKGNQMAVKGNEEIKCDQDPNAICKVRIYVIIMRAGEAPLSTNAIYFPNEEKGWLDIEVGSVTTDGSGNETTTYISNPNTLQINASTIGEFTNILTNMP